jgi:hypothetical protein
MIEVNYGILPDKCFSNYMQFLIGQFYKVIPIYENEPETLQSYLKSLEIELIGNQSLINDIRHDANFMKLVGTIQYFIDNQCDHTVYRKEIFKCINIIKKLLQKYGGETCGNT